MASLTSLSRKVLEEFILLYRDSPCLWQVEGKDYHNRLKKKAAYDGLIEKLKVIEPSADKDYVVKKINNLRSSYRKEMKKVQESLKSASGTEDVHQPKLWYFHLLHFLNAQNNLRGSNSDDESGLEEPKIEITAGDSASEDTPEYADRAFIFTTDESSRGEQTLELASSTKYQPRPPKRSLYSHQAVLTNEVLQSVKDHFNCPQTQDDRHDIFGKNVAMILRDVTKQQRILAEKLINEVLFEAQMGTLAITHKLHL